MVSLKLCASFLLLYLTLTNACQPPDCDRKDCGTCGNACCTVMVYIDKSTEDIYNMLVTSLKKGGYDMRKDNVTADFILQGWHTTLVKHYNDTLDFTIIRTSQGKSSYINAFSISQIATAYCDDGQNYKNLEGLIKSLGVQYEEYVVRGCPQS